jgi:NAD(P)-dependent dehydrogenase (short-subunit alcohol dehydrogenase family)
MNDLDGKVAVVTGAAGGIGRQLATAAARAGMHVALADVDDAALERTTDELRAAGADVIGVHADCSVAADVEHLAGAVVDRFGAVHLLCNNAGVWGKGDPWTGPISSWDWVIGVNLYGVVHGIRTFLPIMERQGAGHILNTGSIAGLIALPGAAPYNATKAAIIAISEGLFLQLKANGSPVGVSVLVPGSVRTDLMQDQPWLGRLGDEPPPSIDPVSVAVDASLTDSLQTGMDPAEVADRALEAVRAGQFWVFTHPELGAMALERVQRAVDQKNPG